MDHSHLQNGFPDLSARESNDLLPFDNHNRQSDEAGHLPLQNPLQIEEKKAISRVLQNEIEGEGAQTTQPNNNDSNVSLSGGGTFLHNQSESNFYYNFNGSGVGNGTSNYTGPSVAPSFAPSLLTSISSAPSNFPTREGLIESTDSKVLVATIQVYGSLYLAFTVLFCVLRKMYPRFYNIRSWVKGLQCDIAKHSDYSWISWLWQVFDEDEDEILQQCGMDALCFIRMLRIGRKLSIVGCFHAVWLIPVYATAEESSETAYLEDRLVLISTANLPSESPRFLATVICAYTIFGYAMWLIIQELEWYTQKRHSFMSQRRPRNYAIYVAGIPDNLRSGPKLAQFFRQTGATSAVLEAHITLACPELEALVAQREAIKMQLEHAIAFEEIHGERETKLSLNFWGLGDGCCSLLRCRRSRDGLFHNPNNNDNNNYNKSGFVATVDSIERLEKKLRQITKDVAIHFQTIERSNDPHTLEQHRDLVMKEIEDLRKAERAQNIANRERVNSTHDIDNVEEIFHDGDQRQATERMNTEDPFSQAAEAFFIGNLSPGHQREQEQKHLLYKNEEQDRQRHVSIHTADNSIRSITVSETPSFDGSDCDVGYTDNRQFRDSGVRRNRNRPLVSIFKSPKSAPPRVIHNVFPSRSTISTIPGTFEAEWTRTTSSASELAIHASDNDHQANPYFQNPGQVIDMPHINEGVSSSSSSDDEDGNYERVKSVIRRRKTNNADNSESNKSWSSGATAAFRKIGDVSKSALEVGAGAAANATKQVGDLSVKNVQNVAGTLNKQVLQAAELGVDNLKTIRASAAAVVPMVLARTEGTPMEAGFVVFKNLYSTQAALQMLHDPTAGVMRVEEAPGPDEIFWRNVGLPASAQRTGRLLSLAATITLCLFWTGPVSFISALTEVNSLKKYFPALGEFVEEHPNTEQVLALIAPFLLLMLQDVVLPEFLNWFAAWEGHVSSSALEAAVFVKYAAFVLVQTFFVSAISGSIAAELSNMVAAPDQLINLLANALPAQSNYFLQILVVAMVVTMSMELLRVVPLFLALLRRFVGPNLTEKERTKRWKFLTPLEDPREFEFANNSGSVVLYFMVYFVYAYLAPICCFFLVVCFFIMETGYRYQFYHNYPPTPDSGGKHWKGFLYIIEAEMIFAQLTLIGFLLLKRSFYAIPFMTPLIACTILFIIYVNRYQLQVTNYLPTSACVKVDNLYRLQDFEFAKGVYVQPCIAEAQSEEIFEII